MSLIPNATSVVGLRLLDLDQAQPTVLQVPIVAWRTSNESEPMPVLAWGMHHDALYDPTTGQVFTECGEAWPSLSEATQVLTQILRGMRDGS